MQLTARASRVICWLFIFSLIHGSLLAQEPPAREGSLFNELETAVQGGDLDAVRRLLKAGVPLASADKKRRRSILDVALANKKFAIALVLHRAGARMSEGFAWSWIDDHSHQLDRLEGYNPEVAAMLSAQHFDLKAGDKGAAYCGWVERLVKNHSFLFPIVYERGLLMKPGMELPALLLKSSRHRGRIEKCDLLKMSLDYPDAKLLQAVMHRQGISRKHPLFRRQLQTAIRSRDLISLHNLLQVRVLQQYSLRSYERRTVEAIFKQALRKDLRALSEYLFSQGYGRQKGQYLIHVAAQAGNHQMIKLLLEAGLSIDELDYDGNTALHICATFIDPETTNFLIKHGANVHARNDYGNTPLHQLFLEELHPDARSSGLQSNDVLLVKALLAAGADPNAKNHTGQAPLDIASTGEIRQLLVAAGAQKRTTPLDHDLSWAIEFAKTEQIKEWIDAGWDIHTLDAQGNNLMHLAAMQHKFELIRFLEQQGLDVRRRDARGRTLLHLALNTSFMVNRNFDKPVEAHYHDAYQDRIRYLTGLVDVNARNDFQQTALHLAALTQNRLGLVVLLQEGADPGLKDLNGLTALDLYYLNRSLNPDIVSGAIKMTDVLHASRHERLKEEPGVFQSVWYSVRDWLGWQSDNNKDIPQLLLDYGSPPRKEKLPERIVLHASNADELVFSIGSNRIIKLHQREYRLNGHLTFLLSQLTGREIHIKEAMLINPVVADVQNLTIEADAGRADMHTSNLHINVLNFQSVKNLKLKGLIVGHSGGTSKCFADVMGFYDSEDILIEDSIFYGSSQICLDLVGVRNLVYKGGEIKECTNSAFSIKKSSDIKIDGTLIHNNNDIGSFEESRNIEFNKVKFLKNGFSFCDGWHSSMTVQCHQYVQAPALFYLKQTRLSIRDSEFVINAGLQQNQAGVRFDNIRFRARLAQEE